MTLGKFSKNFKKIFKKIFKKFSKIFKKIFKKFQKSKFFQNTRHVLVYTTKIYYIHLPIYSIYYINTIISTSKNLNYFIKNIL